MRKYTVGVLAFAALILGGSALCQKSTGPSNLPKGYSQGPAVIPLAKGEAQLDLPSGFTFIDSINTKELLASQHNPAPDGLLGAIIDDQTKVEWFVLLAYNAVGHVDDTDAGDIANDSNGLLDALKKKTQEDDAKLPPGSGPMPALIGWYRPPSYDSRVHTLSASTLIQEVGAPDQTVNFNTALLGRSGIISYTVVGSKGDASYIQTKMEQLRVCIHFAPGRDYASWKPSDGSSGLALAGLLTGGAVLAAKTGLLSKLGGLLIGGILALKKAIILVIAAISGFIKKIKSKVKGQPTEVAAADADGPANV